MQDLLAPLRLSALLFSLLWAGVSTATDGDTREPNRLIDSASPYLQQHAYNPIDWYPWGDEAFAKARRENKPIFLSIGYSTCHWCHVMARESFEDPVVAEMLNRDYVAVKVDRERRPEVDEPYLLATQALTGRSGWPNNLFLTPDLEPFFATVYEPRDTLLSLFGRGSQLWKTDEANLRRDGDRIMAHVLGLMNTRREAKTVDAEVLQTAVSTILASHDEFNGGFAVTPKFPRESWLMLLLHDAEKNGNDTALNAVKLSVDNMLAGGIHDQLAGGFHRYTVDPDWRIPHFEKMLFTQAQMARVLVRLFQLTGDPAYRAAARRTLDFAITNMRDPRGGFYSAFDAEDAEGDGMFYSWTESDLQSALSDPAQIELAKRHFGLDGEGVHKGRHIPYRAETPTEIAHSLGASEQGVRNAINQVRARLLEHRSTRPAPALDRKIVLEWNAMMAIALAEASIAFDAPLYLAAARGVIHFSEQHLRTDTGQMLRIFYEGEAELPAQQRDLALLGLANLAVHDATGEASWLEAAQRHAQAMHTQFHDDEAGDYFMNRASSALPRYKSRDDSAFPSGNSAALALLGELATRALDTTATEKAHSLLKALSGTVTELPAATSEALLAADRLISGHAGPTQHISQGRVLAHLHHEDGVAQLKLQIADGWHINAREPYQDYLTPTAFTVLDNSGQALAKQPDATLPPPRDYMLDYSPSALSLYGGELDVSIPTPEGSHQLQVILQACSATVCLAPTTTVFHLP